MKINPAAMEGPGAGTMKGHDVCFPADVAVHRIPGAGRLGYITGFFIQPVYDGADFDLSFSSIIIRAR